MKLTNTQINAVADKIYNELKVEFNKIQSKNQDKIKEILNKDLKIINEQQSEINEKNKKLKRLETSFILKAKKLTGSEANWLGAYINNVNNLHKLKSNLPSKSNSIKVGDIKSELILATINSSNLEELIKKVKDKFK